MKITTTRAWREIGVELRMETPGVRVLLSLLIALGALGGSMAVAAPVSATDCASVEQDSGATGACTGLAPYALVATNASTPANPLVMMLAGVTEPGSGCLAESTLTNSSSGAQLLPHQELTLFSIDFSVGTNRFGSCDNEPGCSYSTGFTYSFMLQATAGANPINANTDTWAVPLELLAGCALNTKMPIAEISAIPQNVVTYYYSPICSTTQQSSATKQCRQVAPAFLPCLDKAGKHGSTSFSSEIGLDQMACNWNNPTSAAGSPTPTPSPWPTGAPWFGSVAYVQSNPDEVAYGATINIYSANGNLAFPSSPALPTGGAMIVPVAGNVAGGNTVTISGFPIASGATATIGGIVCATPTVVAAVAPATGNTLTCVAPAGSAGNAAVVVTQSATPTTTTVPGGYTYNVPTQNCLDEAPSAISCLFVSINSTNTFTEPVGLGSAITPTARSMKTSASARVSARARTTALLKRLVKRPPETGRPSLAWNSKSHRLVVRMKYSYGGLSKRLTHQRGALNLLSFEASATAPNRHRAVAGLQIRLPKTVKNDWTTRQLAVQFTKADSSEFCDQASATAPVKIGVYPRQTIISKNTTHLAPSELLELNRSCKSLPRWHQ